MEENEKTNAAQQEQKPIKPAVLKDQKTIVRRRDRALMAALGVFTVVIAAIAVLGIITIEPPRQTTQGQADCDVVRVAGKLPGRIVKFYVKEGDYVHKGDTLVVISSSMANASLKKAKSAKRAAAATNQKVEKGTRNELKEASSNMVAQAQAAEDIARKTFQRLDNLYKEGVVTEQKRDEAKAALDAASAAVKAAQANERMAQNGAQQEDKSASSSMVDVAQATVEEVESLLEDEVLLAPCDGEVSEIYPHEGELVTLATAIMSISKLDDMWVTFNVRETMLDTLAMGKTVQATVPALGNKQVQLSVYYLHDMGSYAVWNASKAYGQYDSKTFEVKCRPVKEIEGLRPGMSVILDQ